MTPESPRLVRRLGLHEKIAIAFSILLAGVILVLFVAVRALFGDSVVEMIRGDLVASVASIERTRQIEEGAALARAAVIADSPKLIASVETRDPATVALTLKTWKEDDGFLLVMDQDGRRLALQGAEVPSAGLPALRPASLDRTRDLASVHYWDLGGNVYRCAVAPILVGGDTFKGVLVIATRIDRDWCRLIGQLTRSEVSLMHGDTIRVSTLDDPARAALQAAVVARSKGPDALWQIRLLGTSWLVDASALGTDLRIVYLRTLSPYYDTEARMQALFAVAGGVTVLLAVMLGWAVSRNITHPLRRLIEALRVPDLTRPPRVRLDAADRDVATLEESFNALSEALDRSLSAWENSFDSVSEALFVLDPDDRVVRVNRSGRSTVDALRVEAGDFVHWMRFSMDGPCPACPHPSSPEPVRERTWRDGERTFLVTQAPLLGAGGLVVAALDITDLQQMRAQMMQKEKLAVLGQTIAGVTHELNNPLTSILGHAELLGERIHDEGMRADLERLISDAQRAAQVVRNMLTFARQRKPELAAVEAESLIREAVAFRQRSLERSKVELTLDLPSELPAVRAETFQLQQVLVNLLVNAEQALMEARIATPRICVSARAKGGWVRILVADNGPGLSDAVLSRVFDPFFTTKSAATGTGLGLSICQTIVSQHGGALIAGNGLESGAVFAVHLVACERPARRSVSSPALEPGPRARILLVDDESAVATVLTRVLERMGHEVIWVARARAALESIAETHFDLVVSDLHMPEMNGEEFYREVARRWPEMTSRMVFITGDILSDDTRVFLESLENPYLLKPFKIDEVRRTLGGLLAVLVAP
jgi:signal transduction histidine kinase